MESKKAYETYVKTLTFEDIRAGLKLEFRANESASDVSATSMRQAGWAFLQEIEWQPDMLMSAQSKSAQQRILDRIGIMSEKFMKSYERWDELEGVPMNKKYENYNFNEFAQRVIPPDGDEHDDYIDSLTGSHVALDWNVLHRHSNSKLLKFTSYQANSKNMTGYTPELLVRDSAKPSQLDACHSLLQLIPIDGTRTGELHVEREIGTVIFRVIHDRDPSVEEPDCPWSIISNTNLNIKKLSAISHTPQPDICAVKFVPKGENPDMPLFAVCGAEAKATSTPDDCQRAKIQIMVALQPTMICFIMLHYFSNSWRFDRVLSPEDARKALDERFYAVAIRYTADEVSFFALYPVLVLSNEVKAGDTTQVRTTRSQSRRPNPPKGYDWRFNCSLLRKYNIQGMTRLGLSRGMCIAVSLLTFEQHAHVLKTDIFDDSDGSFVEYLGWLRDIHSRSI